MDNLRTFSDRFTDLWRLQRSQMWFVPTLVFLLVAVGTLSSDSYFLHFDSPTIDVAAYDLAMGCWGEPAATLGPMLFLSVPFLLFGANPLWQIVLLTLLGAAMAAGIYSLTARVTNSQRWALLSALWFISLPTILYYTRMHLGFPLSLFVLGVVLYADQRWFWAGIVLGLAVISHFNFVVPVMAWLFWSALCVTGLRQIRIIALIAGGLLLSLIVVEGINFLFTGLIFGWTRDVVQDALRLSEGMTNSTRWSISHLAAIMAFSNGWLNALLLLLSAAYPLVRRPRIPLMDAIYLTGWSIFAAYSVRIALGNTFLTPRMYAAVYPLFTITTVFVVMRIVSRLAERTAYSETALWRSVLAVGAMLTAFTLIRQIPAAATGSHTGYQTIAEVMSRAGRADKPVRYFGNFHVPYFFGQRYGVESSINDEAIESIAGDTQAVLIFEDDLWGRPDVLESIQSDPRIDPSAYEISTYPHLAGSRPALVENYGVSPGTLARIHGVVNGTGNAPRTKVEVWWPRNPQGNFAAREDKLSYVYYYRGEGCVTPRVYGGDTQNYYHVLAEKVRIIGDALASGDFKGATDFLWTWITE